MRKRINYIFIIAACVAFSSFPSPSQANTLTETLIGKKKQCNYVSEGLYLPFSDVNKDFPLFGTLTDKGCVNTKNNVGNMFAAGFKIFLGLVSLIAVINISIAGIQYMTQEGNSDKKRGVKKRLTDSVVGLILALSGYVILNSVNVRLIYIGFDLSKGYLADSIQKGINDVGNLAVVTEPGKCIAGTVGCGTTTGGTGGTANTPTQYPSDMAAAQKMNAAAKSLLGKTTCDAPSGGGLACAFVVNDIVDQALGKPISGQSGIESSYGLRTDKMKNDLDTSNKFFLVGSGASAVSQLQPGDIIISPTVGDQHGHVGVYTDTGKIISNSSTQEKVDDHYTPTGKYTGWIDYYTTDKKLETYVYRARAQ